MIPKSCCRIQQMNVFYAALPNYGFPCSPSHTPQPSYPLKADWEAVAPEQMESESTWLGSAFTPKIKPKLEWKYTPPKILAWLQNPEVCQTKIRHFVWWFVKYTGLFNINHFTLQPMYGFCVPDFTHLARDFQSTKGSWAFNTVDL